MINALPSPVQHRLEQTLAQWRQWQCQPALSEAPQAVGILGGGISNFTILVEQESRFVVRIDGLTPATNGLNRQVEWHALNAAHTAGIAPRPLYFNPELGSLVCDFLPPDETQEQCIQDIAMLLRGIHKLPARHHRLDLGERIRRYEKQLEHREEPLPGLLAACTDRVLLLLEQATQPDKPVLCHNDLLRANRLYSGGKLWALDWEYCAMGSPWYDLAVVVGGDEMSREHTAQLLHAYLGHAPAAPEWKMLWIYSALYRYIELLWYLALQKCPPEEDFIAGKIAALEVVLARIDSAP